jgi:protoporphyrinogen oxidase
MSARYCTILGGGAAGLAAAHYARRAGLSCTLLEAAPWLGGNARTLAVDLPAGEFRYDTGAHRLHGLDPTVLADVQGLLGEELRRVVAPSRILHRGRFLDFPLRAGNLVRRLGPVFCARAGFSLLAARLFPPGDGRDFASRALRTYGAGVARPFLLDYSAKLWGRPGAELSPAIAGRRLSGLHLGSFLREMIFGPGSRAGTLEGAFYYPRHGIGQIADALAESAGHENLHTGVPVTRIRHDGRYVTAVEVGERRYEVYPGEGMLLSTLPLGVLLSLLDPAPPAPVLALARSLRFRDVVLVAVFLDRDRITPNATVYFPGPETPFNRVCEPRNRSPWMAPRGKTSLVAEIPVESGVALSTAVGRSGMGSDQASPAPGDENWLRPTIDALRTIGWVRDEEILGTAVHRLRRAYPVLEIGIEEKLEATAAWLTRLENLRTSGRVGTFTYTHLHDHLRSARELIAEMAGGKPGESVALARSRVARLRGTAEARSGVPDPVRIAPLGAGRGSVPVDARAGVPDLFLRGDEPGPLPAGARDGARPGIDAGGVGDYIDHREEPPA